ncbi:MAG: rhombotarget lipoprotein [Opitutaceae bacterium]|nr:rhombotarget lipoprotein [Opitutaceae bacterium]
MENTFDPRPRTTRLLLATLTLALTFGLSACVGIWGNHRHEASSVVQFLYPGKNMPFIQPQIPTLRLPLRVGVAFVPTGTAGIPAFGRSGLGFDELPKHELLHKVASQFKSLPFVQSIEIIPATYLRPGGGFENLDQLRALMGIDVVALIAYDQTQNSDNTVASLAYWTIVGPYIVPGQRNTTHTLMEAVVYDIQSRSLLFRAPGTSSIKNHATPIRNEYELRKSSQQSFDDASVQMTANLAQELDRFKVRAREEPESVRIEHKPGYTGGGALDGSFVAILALLAVGGLIRSRR